MATFYDQSALDALLDVIKLEATQVILLDTYTQGQNYATVTGNSIATAAITSGDFTGPTANGQDQRLVFNGKLGAATADSTLAQLHIAIISGSKVLAVTDETSDQAITNGNPVDFPSFFMQASQPDQVA